MIAAKLQTKQLGEKFCASLWYQLYSIFTPHVRKL